MGRYNKTGKLLNDSEYYSFLRKKRNVKKIIQYATPTMVNPGVASRTALKTTTYIWKYGDRFYQLASQYYGDPRYWWVVAWYNGYPTEVDINTGDSIEIPLNLESALKALGV